MKTLTTFALVLLSLSGFCQTFHFESDSVRVDGSPHVEKNIYNPVFNDSDEVTLIWKVVTIDLTPGWRFQVCDNVACIQDPKKDEENFMTTISEESFMDFKVGFQPNDKKGSGMVQILTYEKSKPNDASIETYYFDSWNVGVENEVSESIHLFPNPSRSTTTITFPTSLKMDQNNWQLTNSVGQVLNVPFDQDETKAVLHLENLTPGFYSIIGTSENGTTFSKRLIVQ